MLPEKSIRPADSLADTQYDIDTRQAPRYGCPGRPVLRVMVRPQFTTIVAGVRDISAKGVGILCDQPIELGAAIAVLWDYGAPPCWRTIRANVVRLAPRRHGGWLIGCAFADWLLPEEIEAFLHCDQQSLVISTNA